ncbi:MAG: Ni/Fe-hydrogenase, b-type cytochrome subunit [Polyangiales bacterium]
MTPPPSATAVKGGAPSMVSPAITNDEPLERIYVWDLLVRVSHWVIMVSVFILAITGIYIGKPYLIPAQPGGEHFVMATVKVVHFYTAIIFALAVAARIAWMFVGSYYARWHQFVPVGKRRRGDVFRMLKFYSFLSKEPPLNVGHNPLAGMTYLLVFAIYITLILTGLALYSVSATGYMEFWEFLLPILGGPQTARWIHHIAMWFLLGFVAHHIWSAMLVSRVEGMGLMDSLFSGYKWLPKSWRNRDD